MVHSYLLLVFFFKQKTAYEMRISDWSSDLCSSDLVPSGGNRHIVFDANADALPARRHLAARRDVDARFDGEHHAWLQLTIGAGQTVIADIVYIEPKPVPGLVHVKALVAQIGRAHV